MSPLRLYYTYDNVAGAGLYAFLAAGFFIPEETTRNITMAFFAGLAGLMGGGANYVRCPNCRYRLVKSIGYWRLYRTTRLKSLACKKCGTELSQAQHRSG
jgi:hypothetical protein